LDLAKAQLVRISYPLSNAADVSNYKTELLDSAKDITFYFDGKQYSSKRKTLKEVHAKAAKKKLELELGKTVTGGNVSVEHWAWEWLNTFKANSVGEVLWGNFKRFNCQI
jgi:hypothetical protein